MAKRNRTLAELKSELEKLKTEIKEKENYEKIKIANFVIDETGLSTLDDILDKFYLKSKTEAIKVNENIY